VRVTKGVLPCVGIVSGSAWTGREDRPFAGRAAAPQSKPNSEKIAHREEAYSKYLFGQTSSLIPNPSSVVSRVELRNAKSSDTDRRG
jgi:hypothetical protein